MVDPKKVLDTRPERWKGFIGKDPGDRYARPRDWEREQFKKLFDNPEKEEPEATYE